MDMDTYQILGVKFHNVDMAEALQIMEGFLKEEGSHLVVTVGPEMIMRAQEDPEFKRIVNEADLVVPDGIGVIWAAKRCGIELKERVAGVELIEKFAAVLASKEERPGLFLLGAAPGVSEKTAQKLVERYPGLNIAGTGDGFFKEDETAVANIKSSGAQVVYAALGSPKQEKFVRQHGEQAKIKVGVGVGGSFDVISGLKKRAPQFFVKLHLEWFYRLLCEPSRWRRFLAIPRFMLAVAKQKGEAVRKWEEALQ